MTPTTLDTLFGTPRDAITFGGDIYELNIRLGLPPWYPPAVEVWALREPPDDLRPDQRGYWIEVRGVLDALHDEHERRKQ